MEPDPAPTTVSVALFSSDLRRLRLDGGNPTLGSLARSAGVSKTVLSEAFAGRRLPTERTVAGIVRALDGDLDDWLQRRDSLDGSRRALIVAPSGAAVGRHGSTPDVHVSTSRRTVAFRAALFFTVVAAVVGIAIGAVGTVILLPSGRVVGAPATSRATPVLSTKPQIVVSTGQDPANTPCVKDAVPAGSETGADGTDLQIIWSPSCQAAWARISRTDGHAYGNSVSTVIFRAAAPMADDRQTTTEHDVQSAYTTLIVRPSPDAELCVTGSFTLGTKTENVGDPVCL